MTMYFVKTNADNCVVFTNGNQMNVIDADSNGMFDGIDLYGENAVDELKQYAAKTTFNAPEDMPGEWID